MSSEDKKKNNKAKPKKTQTAKKNVNKKQVQKKPEIKKGKNSEKEKKEKFSKKHPKLIMMIKIFIVLFLLVCVVGAGIIAGIFFGLFGDEFEITKDELKIGASNSVIVDENGAIIVNLSGDEQRKIITLEDMAEYLPKAYVAIEDERYYNHSGVDFKRTAGAIVQTIFSNSSYGGSTITQQLVKNITKDDEASGIEGIKRKVKEWAKAYQVERMISKDQILELYLNILYVGSNGLHGVELGAEYYFNKSAKDLDLAESAFMAGINNSPGAYNAFSEDEKAVEKIRRRTLTVLAKMKELGYIEDEEEYKEAVAKVENGLEFERGISRTGTTYSYHTDAVIEQVITQVMNEKDISRELARNYVYSSGLTIYSTVDIEIQNRIVQETEKATYKVNGRDKKADGTLKNPEGTQAAMVVIDHKTGEVLGVSGGLGEKVGANLNRSTQTVRQPGSAMKPIGVVAPALEEKVITLATVYDDVLTDFNGYKPKNDGDRYKELIGMRETLASSQNVPQIKIMRELTPGKAIDYLRNFGVSSLIKASENSTRNDEGLPLAIGGITHGISPLEMAAAYATIANDGEYISPTFYTKVVDSNGNTVLQPEQERMRVLSEQNAYLLKEILREPVARGTATYCAIPGMSVGAKTGTTDKSYDRWLCGFTNYYTAASWFGYDENEEVRGFSTNPAGLIWSNIMKDIHRGLENSSFVRPSGIVEATVCRATGSLASTGCTNTYKELFTADNMPTRCEGHGSQVICVESEKIATEACVTTRVNTYGVVPPKEKLNLWKPANGARASNGTRITETCTIHVRVVEAPSNETTNNTNNNTNTTNNTNTNSNSTNTNTNTNTNNSNTNTDTNNTNTNTDNSTNTNTEGENTNTSVEDTNVVT